MAVFSQWLRTRKITRVAWVCGPEPVLRWQLIAAYAGALQAAEPVAFWADMPVWDDLLTMPAGPQLRIVHRAEQLGSLGLLAHLLTDEFDGTYTLFMAEEDDFRRDGKQLVHGLAQLRDSRHGQLIRCCAPSAEEDQCALVASWWPGAGKNLAAALLDASGGDLTLAWHAADKAVRAGLPADVKSVAVVYTGGPGDNFADVLMAGDRKAAVAVAAAIPPEAVGGVLGLLASRLQLLPLVREALQRRESPQDMVRRLRVDAWVLRQVKPHAGNYDRARVARCRELLALTETAWRAGARDGILEALVALW